MNTFTWRQMYIFDQISLISSQNEKCFDKFVKKIKTHILNSIFLFFFQKSCRLYDHHHHHHRHLPPWIRSFDLFRHRRIAIVSCGVRNPFFPGVCRWGRISAVWCCPFCRGGWSSFVCIWVSRLVFQRSLVLFLCLRFLFCPVLCIS